MHHPPPRVHVQGLRAPLVALAGVLLVTAYRMVEKRNVRAIFASTRGDAAVVAVTAVCTVAFDLIIAVAVGLALAGALRRMAGTAGGGPIAGVRRVERQS